MNKVIEKIANQSDVSIDTFGYGGGNIEKFAELIIRECVNLANLAELHTKETKTQLSTYDELLVINGAITMAEKLSNNIKIYFDIN